MTIPAGAAPRLHYRHYHAPDGTELSYATIGATGAPTIVLCHGLAANGHQFAADAAHFAAAGFRVLLPDLRGHGRSHSASDIATADFSIATLAGDMRAMLDHAEAPVVHWVGNSLGGIVALQLLALDTARFASLALFGTCFALNLPAAVAPVFPLLHKILGPRLLASITALTTTRHKPARPLIAAMARDFDPRVGAAIAAHVRRYDLTDTALRYPGPLLILTGGHDAAVNMALRPSLARIGPRPNWTIIALPDGGHCANLDATASWRSALRTFWSSHS